MTASVIRSDSTNPHWNLALERFLLESVAEDEVILYLWRNKDTVVIGRSQNPWSECSVPAMRCDGVTLARRSSGGGAVYHDLGNLNFTFVAQDRLYDQDRQFDTVLTAVRMLGLDAVRSGRNDITIDDRKFSGNAFTQSGVRRCHHGTLLISADMDALTRYLSVPAAKLRAKGVRSVRSRVCNLADWDGSIDVERVDSALAGAFAEQYTPPSQRILSDADRRRVGELYAHYSSETWVFGQTLAFDCELEERFAWGGVTVQLFVDAGRVVSVRVYTDALDAELAPELERRLSGCKLSSQDLAGAARGGGEVWDEVAGWLARQGL